MTTSKESFGERQIVDVALPHAAMLQAGALQPVARQQQHVERQIEAEPALDLGAEQFEHAAGAGAEIEQRAERLVGERGADRVLHRLVGDVQLADAVPFGGVRAEIGLRRGGARLRAPRRAARGRARWSDRPDRAASSSARATSAPPPCSARRKNAQVPSRKRSTRPASASSLRWREMRGCDWRRMSVRSETVSSASASSASTRRRVSSPAALRAALRASKPSWALLLIGPNDRRLWACSHYIKISLYVETADRKPSTAIARTGYGARCWPIGIATSSQLERDESARNAMTSQGLRHPRRRESRSSCPDKSDAALYFIGRIRTPWKQRKDCPKNARESDAVCTVELDPRWARRPQGRRDLQPSGRCCTGWTRRRATWCCRCPAITACRAAPLRCARRRGPTRSP